MVATGKYHSFLRVSWRLEPILNLARISTRQHDTRESQRHHE
jgi:hypothetical protein